MFLVSYAVWFDNTSCIWYYALTLITRNLVAKLLGSDYITIKDIQVGGKKHLSYPMKKQEEGIEMVVQFEGVKVIVGEIEKRVKLGTDVLRFLLTVKPA